MTQRSAHYHPFAARPPGRRPGTAVAWRLLPALVLALMALGSGGCTNLGYYAQAVRGHMELMGRRQPIEALLEDPGIDAALRDDLALVLDVRDFATEELGLPDNGSYRTFAALDRPYVVWNVVATPELSLQPRRWCFLFVGCLSYKGYFDEERARRLAEDLRAQGNDVAVGGVAAYSTLGRFPDPFLDTMLGYSDARTAGVIIHELAHQELYIKGDSTFNESFATFVEEEGVRRWFARRPGNAEDARAWADWQAQQQRSRQFTQLVLAARRDLQGVFADPSLGPEAKRSAKEAAYARLREAHARLRDGAWDGYAGYDHWFETVNNARLASIATYRRLLPAFRVMLAQQDGDFPAFLAQVHDLAEQPAQAREERLTQLLAVSVDAVEPGLAPGVER